QIERYAYRGREAFKADQLLQSWFVRHLQIIGEAARLLPQEVCARNTVVSNHGIPGPAAINAVLNFLSSPPAICLNSCAPEKRPCAPVDPILTPGIGYSITPFPTFLDRLGIETLVRFSYAS